MRAARSWWRGGAAAWLLLAAALCLRALVPHGTMPARDAGGTIALLPCGSDGVWLIPLGEAHGNEKGGKDRAAPPCAFAGLSSPAAPPPDLPALPLRFARAESFVPFARLVSPPATPAFRPPARAPPLPA